VCLHLLDVVAFCLVLEDRVVDGLCGLVAAHLLNDFVFSAYILGKKLEDDVRLVLLEVLVKKLTFLQQLLGRHSLVVLLAYIYIYMYIYIYIHTHTHFCQISSDGGGLKKKRKRVENV
jgi:hypothetical protein